MITLNPTTYKTRKSQLPTSLNTFPLLFLLPKKSQIPNISLNSSIFLYLFGYEFPETLLIIYDNTFIVLASDAKLNLLREMNHKLEDGDKVRLFSKSELQKSLLGIGKIVGQKVYMSELLEKSEFTSQCLNYFINTNTSDNIYNNIDSNDINNLEDREVPAKLYKHLDSQEVSCYFLIQSILNTLLPSLNEQVTSNMFILPDFQDHLITLIDSLEITSGHLDHTSQFISYQGELVDFFSDCIGRKVLYDSEDVTSTNFNLYEYTLFIRVGGYCARISRIFSVNCSKRVVKEDGTTLEGLVSDLYSKFDKVSTYIFNKEEVPSELLTELSQKEYKVVLNICGLIPIYRTLSLSTYNTIINTDPSLLENVCINIIVRNKNIEISDILLLSNKTYKEIEMSYSMNYKTYIPKIDSIYMYNGSLNKSRREKDLFFEREGRKKSEMDENQKELLNNLIIKRIEQLSQNSIIGEKKVKLSDNIDEGIVVYRNEGEVLRSDTIIIDRSDINNIRINIPLLQYMMCIPYKSIRNYSALDQAIRINLLPSNNIRSITYKTSKVQKYITLLNSLKNIAFEQEVLLDSLGDSLYKLAIQVGMDFKMTKKLSTGSLELFDKCFTYCSTSNVNNKLVVYYSDILLSYYNIKENENDRYFIHFYLKKPVLFNNKLTRNIQFYLELVEKIADTSKILSKKEELDIEYEELRLKNLYIKQIKQVLNTLNSSSFSMGKMEMISNMFKGVLKERSEFYFSRSGIVCVENPFDVYLFEGMEIACFERVGSDNFDITFVYYTYNDMKEGGGVFETRCIYNVESEYLNILKHSLNNKGVLHISTKMNLNWNEVLKSIKTDLLQFYEGGAWKDLMESESEEVSEESLMSSINSDSEVSSLDEGTSELENMPEKKERKRGEFSDSSSLEDSGYSSTGDEEDVSVISVKSEFESEEESY